RPNLSLPGKPRRPVDEASRCSEGRHGSGRRLQSGRARLSVQGCGMTETYRAIELRRFADGFRSGAEIVTLDRRPPAPGELLVRNLYCGVNGIFDTQIARNAVDYVKIALPTLTGVEALG